MRTQAHSPGLLLSPSLTAAQSLVDAMIENIPPGHMHTGPKTTFEALEEGAEGEKRDFVFHKRGHVETLQVGLGVVGCG